MINLEKLVDFAIRFRIWLLGICLVMVAAAIVPSTGLQFERSIENLFRKDDPRYENYRLDKRLFGGIESAVLAYDDSELFSEAGLTRLAELQQSLQDIEGISKVTSLNDVRRPDAPLDGRKLVEQVRQKAVSVDQLKSEIIGADLYRDRLVSSDGKTAVLLLELGAETQDSQVRAQTIERLSEIAQDHQPPAVVLGGPVLVEEVYTTLEFDGVLLGVASSLILTLVIAILFRSLRWTILPLVVVHVTLIWTKAILALSGAKMSMVSAPLVAMITVIGVATSVHIMIRYREERTGFEAEEALRRTLIQITPAIFWTCLTTAAGFAALLACSILPIQTFALMMSLGSSLVFLAAMMLVPGAALMFQKLGTQLGRLPAEKSLTDILGRMVAMLKDYPWRVALGMIALLLLCSVGAFRLQVATDFTDNFRSTSSIVQSYEFLKQRLGSLETMDVMVEVPEVRSRDFNKTIESLRGLQKELESDERIVDTVSLVDLLDFLDNSADRPDEDSNGGIQSWLPSIDDVPDRAQLLALQSLEPQLIGGFLNREENTARVIVQMKSLSGNEKTELIEHVETVSQKQFPSAKVAGFYVLLASVVQSMLSDQWTTFALAILAIFVIMSIAFRSISLGLAAMVPNAAPILIVLGSMGWLGLEINIATAMMASVSMGLSVDFSIHYLYRFRRELLSGCGFFEALAKAHGSVGRAMVVANLALIAGFLALTLSALIPSVHFGLMVSVTMLGGLIGNLAVLPLLLRGLWQAGLIRTANPNTSV